MIPILLFLIVLVLVLVCGGRRVRWTVGGLGCVLLLGVFFLSDVHTQSAARMGVMSMSMPGVRIAHDRQSGSETVDMPGLHVATDERSGAHSIDLPGVHVAYDRQSGSRTSTVAVDIPSRSFAPSPSAAPSSSYIDPNDRDADRSHTDQLDPDVYPSPGAALAQCARKLLTRYVEKVPDESTLKTVRVRVEPDSADLGRVITALQKEFGWLQVVQEKTVATQPASADATQIHLDIRATAVVHDNQLTGSYVVEGRVFGAAGELTQHARAVDKSWVENPSDWSSVVVIDPPRLGASLAEVHENAIRMAADQVVNHVLNRAGLYDRSANTSFCRTVVNNALLQGELVRDKFVQQFERPYGVIYREALLVDVSEGQMRSLADQYINWSSSQRVRLNRDVLSGAGLLVLIFVVYLFLNAATKGYYVWSLRIAGTVILGVGIVIVLSLR